jgi:AraC-like DNA-binding protein
MTYRELTPPPALRRHVDRLWSRTATDGGAAASPALILPDGCIDVLVDLRTGAARVVGTMTRAVQYSLPPDTSLVAVRFRPGAASAFLRVNAAELTDRVVGVEELGLRWLARAGFGGMPVPRALADLERRLLARIGAVSTDAAVLRATRRLYGEHPPRIAELARELGQSRQHLRRSFREHVGVSPKQFDRVARLQRALDHLQSGRAPSLALAAVQLGYCDQAHMSNDFRELGGITPMEARAAKGSISPIRSLWLEA